MPTEARGGEGRPVNGTRLDDRPPFFRTWKGVYGVVLGFLAFLVVVFEILTRWLA